MIRNAAIVLALAAAGVAPAYAGQCEDNFKKSGNVLSGVDFSSSVTVPDLSVKHAMAQMKGILVDNEVDLITEDAGTGSMLFEQRSSNKSRALPILVNVNADGKAAAVDLTLKFEKYAFAKQDKIRVAICEKLARLQGGKAGIAAAAQGEKARNNDNVTAQDVYMFSREIAREAEGNAVAVTARRKGRKYALKGRVDYIQPDGDDTNISFDIPEQSEMMFSIPGADQPRVGVACLFRPNQMAQVLTFRKGDKANFTGQFLRYDDFKRMAWLENCTQVSKK